MISTTQTNVEQFKIMFDHRDHYLYVQVSGESAEYPVMKRYWNEIAKKSKGNDCRRVLLEKDMPVVASLTDTFRIASELHEMDFLKCRLAVVDPHPINWDRNDFAELVATNRGIRVRFFRCVQEAEGWLTQL